MAAGFGRVGPGDPSRGRVRVGDAEREATAAQLREHFVEGRLTLDEFNERLDRAFAARTRADLDRVTADLPAMGQATSTTHPVDGHPFREDDHAGPSGRDRAAAEDAWRRRAGLVAALPAALLTWLLLVLGGTFAFGMGRDRPLGIILLLIAVALLRRMVRRRRRARRRGRCGLRW